MQRRRLLSLLVFPLFSGCSLFSESLEKNLIHRWSGKFSIIPTFAPRQNTTGAYRLSQSADGLELDFLGPLQTTLARLRVDAQGATWSEAGQPDVSAPDAESLMRGKLGFALTPTTLLSWLQGVPDSQNPVGWNSSGSFIQSGWTVEILSKNEDGTPRRLRVLNADYRLTLSVKQDL